jgi:NAD(P)-dependent dehydrogenase (short-subunit alcohol dehydrogenase family)
MRRRNSLTKKAIENSLSFKTLDLTSLKQIEECAATLNRDLDRIDILVNNAGVMAIPSRELTSDGFEKHIGINHLGF